MLHKDLAMNIAKNLRSNVVDLVSFGRTCQFFHRGAQPFLDNEAFKRFLDCAIYGKEQEAEDLLSRVSIRLLEILLTRRATFKDAGEYRTYVDCTIGQFLLSSNDHSFWNTLQPFYREIPNGLAVRLAHIAEQFPETPQAFVNTYDFDSLVLAFNQINMGPEDDARAALNLELPAIHPFALELAKFRL